MLLLGEATRPAPNSQANELFERLKTVAGELIHPLSRQVKLLDCKIVRRSRFSHCFNQVRRNPWFGEGCGEGTVVRKRFRSPCLLRGAVILTKVSEAVRLATVLS